jgi:hypothetical protein
MCESLHIELGDVMCSSQGSLLDEVCLAPVDWVVLRLIFQAYARVLKKPERNLMAVLAEAKLGEIPPGLVQPLREGCDQFFLTILSY